jgi:hypothetical protein
MTESRSISVVGSAIVLAAGLAWWVSCGCAVFNWRVAQTSSLFRLSFEERISG